MFKSGSVTIVVNDLKKAEQFYVETLGLKVQYKVEGHLVLVGRHPGFDNWAGASSGRTRF